MTQLGPFALVRPIGKGGHGEVWRAVHPATGVEVAVKGLASADPALRPDFFREVRLLAGLRHRHVIHALDAGEVPPGIEAPWPVGAPWFAMVLAEGSLADRRPADWEGTVRALDQVLAGLAHAHAHGVLHRDIKPQNILSVGDRWVVADFGIGSSRFGTGERRGAGTPEYMAPEQVAGRAEFQGPATDLYAVGCLAWDLVTGRPPFTGEDRQQVARLHLTGPLPPWTPLLAVPPGFTDWLGGLLARRPEERFPSAATARTMLATFRGGPLEPATAAPVSPFLAPTVAELLTTSIDEAPWSDPTGEELRPLSPVAGPAPAPPADEPGEEPTLVGVGLGLVELREPPLVGREAERAVLWTALSEVAREGRPRLLVLRAPSGAGASRLAAWVAEGCTEVGLGPWVQLSEGSDVSARVIEDLVRQEPRLRTLPSAQVRGRLEGAAVALLREGARGGAAVVWCDDGRDPAGRAFVASVVQSAEAVPALIVVTLSDGPGADAAASELQALARWAPVSTVQLGPLPSLEHHLLVASIVGLDGVVARSIEGPTSGSPGAVVQLVRHLARSGRLVPGARGLALAPGAEITLPASRDAALEARVHHLVTRSGEPAAHLLECAAVSGARVPRDRMTELARQLGVPGPSTVAHAAAAAWLWTAEPEGWRFTEPAVRQALVRRAEAAGRLRAHHRACLATTTPDEENPTARFEHAYAAGDGATAFVAGCSVLSFHLAQGDTRIDDLLERTERCLPLGAAGQGAWQLRFLRTWLAERRGAQVHATYADLAAEARREGWTLQEATVLRRAGRAHADAPELAVPLYERAEALFRAIGDLPRAGECAGARADALVWRDPPAAAAGFRVLRELRPTATGGEIGLAILALLADRLDEAEQHLAALPPLPTTWVVGQVENLRGELARKRGALEAAERHYRRAAAQYLAICSATAAYPLLNLALVHLRRGQHLDATRLAHRVLATGPGPELEVRAHAILLAAGSTDPGADLARLEATLQGRPVLDGDVRNLLTTAARELPAELAARCLRVAGV